MSKNNSNQILFELSEADQEIHVLATEHKSIEATRSNFLNALNSAKEQLAGLEGNFEGSKTRQAEEEQRLREEEQRIIDRRKQLTGIGGAKAAKLVEREIDIASKSVESLEARVLGAAEKAEGLETQVEELREQVDSMEATYEEDEPEREKTLKELTSKVSKLEKQREKLAAKLDARLESLYKRVTARYPGDAVAVAEVGACRKCFRALPPQTFNQVLAGNTLIQCPGCSRILVMGDK